MFEGEKQEGICQWAPFPPLLLLLLCVFFLAISVSPLPYPALHSILFEFLFALLFIAFPLSPPYTDAVEPRTLETPPPVAVPASQRAVAIRYRLSSEFTPTEKISFLYERCALLLQLYIVECESYCVPIANMMTGSVKWTNTGWWPWLTCLSTHSQRIFIRRM